MSCLAVASAWTITLWTFITMREQGLKGRGAALFLCYTLVMRHDMKSSGTKQVGGPVIWGGVKVAFSLPTSELQLPEACGELATHQISSSTVVHTLLHGQHPTGGGTAEDGCVNGPVLSAECCVRLPCSTPVDLPGCPCPPAAPSHEHRAQGASAIAQRVPAVARFLAAVRLLLCHPAAGHTSEALQRHRRYRCWTVSTPVLL